LLFIIFFLRSGRLVRLLEFFSLDSSSEGFKTFF
jgi:hypothetical protein